MKASICLLFLLVLHITVDAQNIEIGLAGGISTNSAPSDNIYYKSDKAAINYGGTLTVLYNFMDHMQYGIEAHVLELSGTSDKVYTGLNGLPIGGDDKKFVYAKNDAAVCGVFNGRLDVGRGYVYAGAALGYNISRQSSTTLASNESYRTPDGGHGFVFGAQLGYVYGVSHKLGFFAEAAYRYIDLKYDAEAPAIAPKTDLHYHLTAMPVMIGIRYRILNTIVDNHFQGEIGNRRSRNKK